MIADISCLGVIAGRGGSKGLPGKNLKDLGGRPLIAWSAAAAKQSAYLDWTVVSSDDDDILAAARDAGCDMAIRRPTTLATDEAAVAGSVLHALDETPGNFGIVVLLAATSPLRTGNDIDACIEACHRGASSAVTISATSKPAEWICRLEPDGRLSSLIPGAGLHSRRQDLQPAYLPNGAVYAAKTEWFRRHRTFYGDDTVGCIMPKERSVDIDNELDLMIARWTLTRFQASEDTSS